MPIIRPISDLRNHADKISDLCHRKQEPVFITKNGKGDLVVMSQAFYEKEIALGELHRKLDEGEKSLRRHPKGMSHSTLMRELRDKLA